MNKAKRVIAIISISISLLSCNSIGEPFVDVYLFQMETDIINHTEMIILRKEPTIYEWYCHGVSAFGCYNKRGDTLTLSPSLVLDENTVYSAELYTREKDVFFVNSQTCYLIHGNQLIDITDYEAYSHSLFVSSLPELDQSLIQSAVSHNQLSHQFTRAKDRHIYSSPVPTITIYRSNDTTARYMILRESNVFELYGSDSSERIIGYWETNCNSQQKGTVVLTPSYKYEVEGGQLRLHAIDSTVLVESTESQWTYTKTQNKMEKLGSNNLTFELVHL